MRQPLAPTVRIVVVACVLLLTLTVLHAPMVRAADPDTDLDGLTDAFEAATLYTQRATGSELPKALVDGGTESATTTLLPWQGIVNGSFAEFTLNHPAKSELTVQVGYWDGASWVDRYVWDPGARLVGVTITEPIASQVLAGTVTVTAAVPADDTIAKVAFFLGTSLLGTATTPSAPNAFSMSLDTTAYRSGAYDLIAIAIDELGATAVARIPVSIQDTAKPSVSFVAPLNAYFVTGTYHVRVRATDADGIASVRLRVDKGTFVSILGNVDGDVYWCDWATASLRAGLHTLTAEAKDKAGQASTTSVVVTVDNAPPTTSITSPAGGASLSGAVTVQATASDNLAVSEVQFSVDGRPIGSDSIPPYKVSWDSRFVSDGSHQLRATAFDWARNAAHQEIAVSTSNGGDPPDGTITFIVAALTKPRGEVTLAERIQRILPAEYGPELFHSFLTWRIVVRDWAASGTQGSLTAFTLRVEERSDPTNADTDGDTLTDGDEVRTHGTYPTTVDTDGDGARDDVEVVSQSITYFVDGKQTTATVKTSPTLWDTDGDSLSDGEEYSAGVDRVITDPVLADTDGDTLTDGAELVTYNSNATLTDTDQDTLRDDVEVIARWLDLTIDGLAVRRSVTTLPSAEDSDGDGLMDDREFAGTSVYGVETDPSDADTDDDGLMDGQEKYALEFSITSRKTIGTSLTLPLTATYAGDLERVDVRYGLSAVDVSNFYVTLTKGSTTVVLRDRVGTGLYNYSSAEITTAFGSHGGDYILEVSSPASGGVLEEYALTFTLRTSPILADSDGDGLNDSEETTHGADAWITDANRADMDGDTWSDGFEINAKATSPLSADTDQDGARDDMDLDPLRNLLVAVSVNQIHHGADPWCSPELVGVIRVNDDYTWVSQHVVSTLDSFTSYLCPFPIPTTQYSTSSFAYTYYADVPDEVATVSLRATAWAINPGRGDDILVDENVSYDLNSGTLVKTLSNANSWYSFSVSTHALPKATTLLITEGNATVAMTSGQHRLAGHDRYFVLTLDVTSAYGPLVNGVNTIVVPRSIFLESKLKADFDAGRSDPDRFSPLADATLYGEDFGKADVSEGVAGVIAEALSGSDAIDVLDRLLRNTTGVRVYTYVDLTTHAVAANLPADVVRMLPWVGVTDGLTGPEPSDFWGKLGASVTRIVNRLVSLGQLLYKGLVTGVTFLANLGEAIVDWGMQALGTISTSVAPLLETASLAFGPFVSWIIMTAISHIERGIESRLNQLKQVLDDTLGRFIRELGDALYAVDVNELSRRLNSLIQLATIIIVAVAVLPVAIRLASIAIKVLTAGVSWLVETAIAEGVVQFVVRILMGVAFVLAVNALFTVIAETLGWVEDTTVSFFKGLGIIAAVIAAVSKVAFRLHESLFVKTSSEISVVQRYKGFAVALFGLAIVVYGSAAFASNGVRRLVADFAGFALQLFGVWLYARNAKDPLVQIGDLIAPVGSKIEYGVTMLTPPVTVLKMTHAFASGAYG